MRISRYIKFPLIFGLLMLIPQLLIDSSINESLFWFGYGVLFGIGLQLYSDYKTRKIKPDAEEPDFAVRQKKETFLLCDYDEAFDICLDSVSLLRRGKVRTTNKEKGYIKAKTGISWNSWGSSVEFKLKEVTENVTEIEIFTRPVLRTILVDYGEGIAAIEVLQKAFDSKNEEIHRQLVEAKFDVPVNVSINHLQDVKIKN